MVGALTVASMQGCDPSEASSSIRAAIAAGLVASADGPTAAQAQMFRADIRGSWAATYDPADPPGCEPGGLWGAPDGPAIPNSPCAIWVLVRRKNRWMVSSHGLPGRFDPPAGSPKDLGDPGRLVYLAPGS